MADMDIAEYETVTSFLDNLAILFRKMDDGYAVAAKRYGFVCAGCTESCCETRFYHHTLLELMYLHKGLETLKPEDRRTIDRRARDAALSADRQPSVHVMCPLNQGGRCLLYAHRPMICRLHGIPHELRHPVRGIIRSPGCHEFEARHAEKPYAVFDRTPLYQELAQLETFLRQETGFREKIKMTIAEMIIHNEK